jgi:flavin reductase (DIM6/NTAB) family NADH-FMN oxidoreductase RutF
MNRVPMPAEPQRLLLSASETSSSWKQPKKYPFFAVNILHADHQNVQFAGRGGLNGLDRYGGAHWTRLSTDGAAILNDALAGVDCAVEEILPRHGHAIVIGRIKAIVIRSNGHPLLYWQGAYQQIAQKQSAQKQGRGVL